MPPISPDDRIIDMHAHFFNVSYLPLSGIIKSRAPGLSLLVCKVIAAPALALTFNDSRLRGAGDDGEEAYLVEAEALPDELAQCIQQEPFSAKAYLQQLCRAVHDAQPAEGMGGLLERAGHDSGEARGTLETELEAASEDEDALDGVGTAIRFARSLMSRESDLMTTLIDHLDEPEAIVHHTMDMDHAYSFCDTPRRSWSCAYSELGFEEQLRRLNRLGSLPESADISILGFAAFDPFRGGRDGQDDNVAVNLVQAALELGYHGVKFYPPSGYRPAQNVDHPLATADQLDRRCKKLFDLCIKDDVPLMAHCTPTGMERHPGLGGQLGSGQNSDPKYWEMILKDPKYTELRLCFGHAGGKHWFDPIVEGDSLEDAIPCDFPGRVYCLCTGYPNVYCDFSHAFEVFKHAEEFALRLSRLAELDACDPEAAYCFMTKIMFGTDFPMREDDGGTYAGYLGAWREAFTHRDLPKHASAFFAGNAKQFLKIGP